MFAKALTVKITNKIFYIFIGALLFMSAVAVIARADAVIVRKTADTNNPLPCSNCSLREAINTINQSSFPGVNNIAIEILPNDPGCSTNYPKICTIRLTLGTELLVSSLGSLVIDGGAANLTIIDGMLTSRIFRSFSDLTVKNLTMQRGNGLGGQTGFSGSGSAIFMNGTIRGASLTLDSVVIQNNDSTFTTSGSGSVYFYGGSSHIIRNSTFSGNSSATCAGFVLNGTPSSTLSVYNTTVSFNTALSAGGGLCTSQFGMTTLRNATIADNTAFAAGGGGIFVSGGTLDLGNTIVAHNVSNNAAFPADIRLLSANAFLSAGGNLIGDNSTTASIFPIGQPDATGDWVGDSSAPINPLLAPLGLTGGTTPTRPLYSLSLANNHGGGLMAETQADQRGALRGGTSDIGAFEANSVPYTAFLPQPIINQPYLQTITPNNNGNNYCVSSGNLPPGITGVPICFAPFDKDSPALSPDASVTILGTPILDGSFPFTITVSNGANSFTANYEIDVFVPSAASVAVGGQIITWDGTGISQAHITLIDTNGSARSAISNAFGYFRFDTVEAGQTYIVSVRSKRYQFSNPTQSVVVADEITDLNFTALP